jgi:hypothetical protein
VVNTRSCCLFKPCSRRHRNSCAKHFCVLACSLTMLSSLTRQTLVVNKAFLRTNLRFSSSLIPPTTPNKSNKREIHNTPRREADASPTVESSTVTKSTPSLIDRFTLTAEVTVSKIFPAGFGWQTASIVASNNYGLASDSMNFALSTGVGDAIGVVCGHVLYYATKKNVYDSSIDMKKEGQTGILLGTAALFSGTAWQPIVNALQGANLPFVQVFAGTWFGCGAAFYIGLRLGRTILSGYMEHIHEPTYENSLNDKALSASIGGATGFFVGTDAAYLPDQNFLIDYVGIMPGTSDLMGCAIAGTSTSMGFFTAQNAMNIVYPAGKCWTD